jgi:uncharacterized protein YgbK (DUF1537 family)
MSGNPLSDKTVVVSGTLSEMTRKEVEKGADEGLMRRVRGLFGRG